MSNREIIERIRVQIRLGFYDTDRKLDVALDRMLDHIEVEHSEQGVDHSTATLASAACA